MTDRPRPMVVVFCKAPVPGRLKTRLMPQFAPEEAAALGMAMLLDVLDAVSSPDWQTIASVAHDDDRGIISALVPNNVEVCAQPQGDLGERMSYEMSRHGGQVAIVGSDCPEISTGHIRAAFAALDDGADAAMCPSADGGYSLIAGKEAAPPLFRGIPWSTDQVIACTRMAARTAGLRLDELAPVNDVDYPDDVSRLIGVDTDVSVVAARTRAVAVSLRNKRPGLAFSD